MWHHWGDGGGAGTWLLMGSGMLLFWALVATGIVWLVRSARSERRLAGKPSARDILDARYARGEVDDEEYRTRRENLADR